MAPLEVDKIKKYFPNHRVCLVKVLVILVSCILLANNCNLNKAKKKGSQALGKVININSLYTRFIRFFKMANSLVFVICILRLVRHLLADYIDVERQYTLSIDRTNWKLGIININILTIGLVLENGKFIPLYFELLDKRGNSNEMERKQLLLELQTIFNFCDAESNLIKPLVLVGDREFIGKQWFKNLVDLSYDLVIRLRKKDYLQLLAEQMKISLSQLENKIRNDVATKGYFTAPIEIKGHLFFYHVRMLKGKKDELSKADKDIYIRFISTQQDISWVSKTYDKRWKIEVFFEDIKEKGIRLEQINFKDFDKIRLMVAVASLCYALCIHQGLIAFEKRLISMKKDKRTQKQYPRTSIFTKGYEILEQTILNVNMLNELIISILKEKKQPIHYYSIVQLIKLRLSFEKSV